MMRKTYVERDMYYTNNKSTVACNGLNRHGMSVDVVVPSYVRDQLEKLALRLASLTAAVKILC